MIQRFVTVLLIMAISCSDETEIITNNQPFIGNWTLIEVVKDGVLQSEWPNTNLTINQENEIGGTYQMANTPYDSIWSINGSWGTLDKESMFVLDDTITVNYWINNDTLHLIKYLPWTSIPCEPSEPCVLVVTGQWNFIFNKSQ